MYLLVIGLVLLVAKLAELGPTAVWPWWAVLAPFGGAIVWWAVSDAMGLTRLKAMRKMDERKAERRERALSALGLDPQHKRQVDRARAQSQASQSELLPTPSKRELERKREPSRGDPRL